MKILTNPSHDDFGDAKSQSPGFQFHPTDEELILYYLKRVDWELNVGEMGENVEMEKGYR